MDSRDKRKQHEIDARLEELGRMPLDEFAKTAPAEMQSLLSQVMSHMRHIEGTADELQNAKNQLDEIRRELVDLYDFAPVGYFNLNTHGDVVRANITASDMLNIQRNALTNRPFADLVEEHHRQALSSFLEDLAQTRSRMSTELEMRRGDGSVFYAQLQAVPLYEKSFIVYRVSIADITARMRAEAALRESEARLRNVFESMDEGFALCEMIYDDKGNPIDFRYLEVNPAFTPQTGLPVAQVVGHTVRQLIPSVEPFWIETYARVVKSGQSERIENRVHELNKVYEVHAWKAGPLRFAVVFHDITGLKTSGRRAARGSR